MSEEKIEPTKNFIEIISEKAKWRKDEHVSTLREGETSVTRLRVHQYVKLDDVKEAVMTLITKLREKSYLSNAIGITICERVVLLKEVLELLGGNNFLIDMTHVLVGVDEGLEVKKDE